VTKSLENYDVLISNQHHLEPTGTRRLSVPFLVPTSSSRMTKKILVLTIHGIPSLQDSNFVSHPYPSSTEWNGVLGKKDVVTVVSKSPKTLHGAYGFFGYNPRFLIGTGLFASRTGLNNRKQLVSNGDGFPGIFVK
jgi:hypothetical protein